MLAISNLIRKKINNKINKNIFLININFSQNQLITLVGRMNNNY